MLQLRAELLIGPNGSNIHLGDRARRRITGEELRYSRVRHHHPQKYVRGAWRAKVELFRDSLERRRMAEFLLVLGDKQRNPEEGAIKLVQRLALGRLGENRVVKIRHDERLARLDVVSNVVHHSNLGLDFLLTRRRAPAALGVGRRRLALCQAGRDQDEAGRQRQSNPADSALKPHFDLPRPVAGVTCPPLCWNACQWKSRAYCM